MILEFNYLGEKYEKYFVTEKNENPKVSVIVPCYNVEKYIEDCIASLIKQTFKDIEIICVDDGSVDLTPKILKSFAELDTRVKVICQKNSGVSAARNAGVHQAKGEYITFLDSDDWVNESYIEKLYDAITRNNADIAVSEMIRKRPHAEKYRLRFEEVKIYTDLQEKIDVCRIPSCCYICGKLFNKKFIENSPFKTGVYYEDVIWLPEIIKAAKLLVVVPKTYYYYRVNNNSIVKSVQSVQKQHDSYTAKKYIVRFFEENGLKLSKHVRSVTKYIKYLFKIPVLKVKECDGYEKTLLFGFLPINKRKSSLYYKFNKNKKMFFFRDLDAHYYVNIFGLHLGFKHKQEFHYDKVTNLGVTDVKRSPQLIVSLASYPARINTVNKTIETLLTQTVKPDRLILWLAYEQFPNKEGDLPQNLLELKQFGLEIGWSEDLKSYKKLVPALQKFPEDIIVTADDDLYYQKDWLESLYSAYLKDSKNIYTRRACRVVNKGNVFKNTPHYSNTHYEPDFSNQLMGGAGTIYPPHSLHKDVFKTELIKTLVPTYDDIYFWAMAIINGTKIGLVKNKDLNIYNVEGTQDGALCKINGQNDRMSDREAFNRVFEKYPVIPNLLRSKS